MTSANAGVTQFADSPPRWAAIRNHWRIIRVWVELTRNLAVRDVQTRYKHSMLGLYWAIINPLLNAAIFTFVFQVIFKTKSPHIPYIVFFISGMTAWTFFANALTSATTSVTGSAALLAKLYFPRTVLPTAAVLARLIDLAFSAIIVLFFTLLFQVHVYWTALFIIPLLALQTVFTLGVAYLLSALNVLFRDMTQLIGLVLMIWMYLSPVIYPARELPSSLQSILLANPVGALIEAERNLLYTGHLTQAPYLWMAAAWAGFVFLLGLSVFTRLEPLFAEVM